MNHRPLAIDDAASVPWDAIVLGAGPAGALLSRRLAIAGARVLLVEKKAFPRRKVCGACLNQDALEVLGSEGLETLVDDQGGVPLEMFHVGLGGRSVRLPLPGGRALSRERFDLALVTKAIRAGVDFLPETLASVEPTPNPATRSVRLDQRGRAAIAWAKVVVVAAGLGHRALEHVSGTTTRVAPGSRVGAGCTLEDGPDDYVPGVIHMAVGGRGYVGLVRLEDGRLNLGAAFDRGFVRSMGEPGLAASSVLAEAGFPAIVRLDQADWQGTPGLTRRSRPVSAHRLVLIGDAAGYVEPFTGQGMACALASARSAAPIVLAGLASWSPALERAWSARHASLLGRRYGLCRALTASLRRPLIARVVFNLATWAPTISQMMIHHVNRLSVLAETSPTCP